MPIGAQPPGRKGTVGHAYSALNLRLAFATFGLVSCTVLGILALAADFTILGWLLIALAVVAAVDLVVIQLRRRARRRAGEEGHSLFE
ncbi:MAG TPA: hypothetical protein VK028_16650 [Micromonosporaceae bacterium]|nr:hypothetical protein [Micromonosporaceae bacterium]